MKDKLEKFQLPGLIIRVKEQKKGTYIEGYASVFQPKDRQGDTVDPAGLEQVMEEYMLNPVLAANHENSVFTTVGQIVKYRIDKIGLWIRAKLSESTDEATQTVVQKIKEGTLRALSIWGDWTRDKSGVINIKDLFHIGVVQVPANPLCVFALAKLMSGEDTVCTKCSDCEKETEMQKAVVPFVAGEMAPEDYEWDASKEQAAGWEKGVDYYKKMHAYFDADASDLKGSYHLPHHRGEDLATVKRGCLAAGAAIMGARGADIPDEAKTHMAGHYKQMDMEPPWKKAVEGGETKEVSEHLASIDARLAAIEEKLEPKKEEPKPDDKTPPPEETVPVADTANLTEEALQEQIAHLETRVAELTRM